MRIKRKYIFPILTVTDLLTDKMTGGGGYLLKCNKYSRYDNLVVFYHIFQWGRKSSSLLDPPPSVNRLKKGGASSL